MVELCPWDLDWVGYVTGQVVEEARRELAKEGRRRQGTVLSENCGQLLLVGRDRGQRPERDPGSPEDVWDGQHLSMRARDHFPYIPLHWQVWAGPPILQGDGGGPAVGCHVISEQVTSVQR